MNGDGGTWGVPSSTKQPSKKKEGGGLKGPLRLIRLCILSIVLPGILIAGPLYLRYRVYSGQVYPVGMTDMRLVDSRISTTWCQKQLVKSNATFNAYLLPDEPKIKPNPVRVFMVRHLHLKDDMKEYWGFYLLKGSSFTISTCCRWPGAFLTVIRGHKQLRECAYFGDDSSEEEDELEKIEREKNGEKTEKTVKKEEKEGKSNEPWLMKRARPGVVFHGSQQQNTLTKHRLSKEIVSDNGNEHLNDWLPMRSKKIKSKHVYESKKKKEKINETTLEDIYGDVVKKMRNLGHKENKTFHEILAQLYDRLQYEDNDTDYRNLNNSQKKRDVSWERLKEKLVKDDAEYDVAEEEEEKAEDVEETEEDNLFYEDIRGTFNETSPNDKSESEYWSSFSSSEERLIECDGLIVNLPLTPKKGCQASNSVDVQQKAGLVNKFSYMVPYNGYYFFVFSSENEIQPNYIRVEFEFQKMMYNVSNSVVACTNATDSCSLPLNFFSWEKTVLEMPLNQNDTMWNQEFIVVSTCEPRTIVYAACVVLRPTEP